MCQVKSIKQGAFYFNFLKSTLQNNFAYLFANRVGYFSTVLFFKFDPTTFTALDS